MTDQYRDYADRRKALDPSVYKPKYYIIDITCGAAQGATGSGSVTLDATPFVADSISHGIISPEGGGQEPEQDGQYRLLLRDDETTYQSQPMNAVLGFGSAFTTRIIPLPLRIFFRGSRTITTELINDLQRSEDPDVQFNVQIVIHGFEMWSAPNV